MANKIRCGGERRVVSCFRASTPIDMIFWSNFHTKVKPKVFKWSSQSRKFPFFWNISNEQFPKRSLKNISNQLCNVLQHNTSKSVSRVSLFADIFLPLSSHSDLKSRRHAWNKWKETLQRVLNSHQVPPSTKSSNGFLLCLEDASKFFCWVHVKVDTFGIHREVVEERKYEKYLISKSSTSRVCVNYLLLRSTSDWVISSATINRYRKWYFLIHPSHPINFPSPDCRAPQLLIIIP